MKVIVTKNYDEMSKEAAKILLDQVKNNPHSTLGLATGSSPIGTYQEIIKAYQNGEVSFKNVTTYNLDEYCGIDITHPQSYYCFMHDNLFNHVDINEKNVHILCYLPDSPDMLEGLCKRNSLARKKAGHFMMLQTAKRFPITTEFIMKCATGSTNLYKKHIMQALIECGYADSFNGDVYKALFTKESENNILVVPKYENVKDVIDAIHTAGGIAILAHPVKSGCVDILDDYIEYGIDGIEVFHPSATEEEQTALKKYATKNKILATGGSDFHGENKPDIQIGVGRGNLQIPMSYLEDLCSRRS